MRFRAIGLFVIVALAAGYAGLCGLLYAKQDRLLYPGAVDSNPAGFTALRIQSGSAVLKIWTLHTSAGPALLYFGGNGEDLGADLPDFDKAFPDRAVYFMNYRGYAGSTGSPSEAALIADAEVTYDVIRKTHGKVALMGRSLGTGVAVALACPFGCAGRRDSEHASPCDRDPERHAQRSRGLSTVPGNRQELSRKEPSRVATCRISSVEAQAIS
jgi:fermentation-respiration switch protein FrsA (DUF1100 family)